MISTQSNYIFKIIYNFNNLENRKHVITPYENPKNLSYFPRLEYCNLVFRESEKERDRDRYIYARKWRDVTILGLHPSMDDTPSFG